MQNSNPDPKLDQNRPKTRFWPDLEKLHVLSKSRFLQKLVKIGFWVDFGPILDPETNSACKTAPGDRFRSIFHRFLKNRLFINLVFWYFLIFGWYFEAREHQNRTQHEKIPPGSYSEIFWPAGKPEQPPTSPQVPPPGSPLGTSPGPFHPPSPTASRAFPQCYASRRLTQLKLI